VTVEAEKQKPNPALRTHTTARRTSGRGSKAQHTRAGPIQTIPPLRDGSLMADRHRIARTSQPARPVRMG